MKATYRDKEVFVTYVSSDEEYVLITYDLDGKSKIFKEDLINIKGLKKSDLKKLKRK